MENWTTLPTIAHEIGVAESTARRWAAALDEFLPSHGRGAGRRFDPRARQVLAQAKTLYGRGLTTQQISDSLRREVANGDGRGALSRPPAVVERLRVAPAPRDVPTAAAAPVTMATVEALGDLHRRTDEVGKQLTALRVAVDETAAAQARDNGRFRAVVGALVDLLEVQDHNRRLSETERERRADQDRQRIMLALQELLSSSRARRR